MNFGIKTDKNRCDAGKTAKGTRPTRLGDILKVQKHKLSPFGKERHEDLKVSYGSHVRGRGWNRSSSEKYDTSFFDNLSPISNRRMFSNTPMIE